ncbi:MAG TPA: lysophospholipid acyltransferase family protein [Bacteroidia bacterium]|nr:lysophospholipid acyltransferase family protein [Bacteroidia bacterium]
MQNPAMIILRFLRAIFGFYAVIVFAALLIVFSILYAVVFLVLPEKSAPHFAHRVLSRTWAKMLQVFFFLPVRIENKNLIDPGKTYVFVANHRSQLDIPVYAIACRNTFRFLAKAELAKIPLMGFIIRKLYLTVNRADRADRNRSIEVMKRSIDDGISVFLCPEGTRNRHDEPPVMEFRDGAFRLAVLTQTPLAVLTLFNTGEKLSPLRPVELAPGTIYGTWDEPIETKGMTLDDVPALKEKVRSMMIAHLREYRGGKS